MIQPTRTAADPVGDSPGVEAAGPLYRQFAMGDAEAIATTSAEVSRVVQFRGYYIPPDERPDVVQDAMLDVLRALKAARFDSDREFFGFIRTVTHRRCVDWVRQRRKKERLDPVASCIVDPGDRLLAKERRELATEIVSRLKDPCRDLFALHVGIGMTYGQLAEHFGRTEGALRTQAYECLKQARKMLDHMRRRRNVVRMTSRRTQ